MKKAFTLIEILIVVILLGILAAVVIPQFTNTAEEAGTEADRSTLRTLKSQVELYSFREGSAPADLNALVTDGYIEAVPEAQSNTWGTKGSAFTLLDVTSADLQQ